MLCSITYSCFSIRNKNFLALNQVIKLQRCPHYLTGNLTTGTLRRTEGGRERESGRDGRQESGRKSVRWIDVQAKIAGKERCDPVNCDGGSEAERSVAGDKLRWGERERWRELGTELEERDSRVRLGAEDIESDDLISLIQTFSIFDIIYFLFLNVKKECFSVNLITSIRLKIEG